MVVVLAGVCSDWVMACNNGSSMSMPSWVLSLLVHGIPLAPSWPRSMSPTPIGFMTSLPPASEAGTSLTIGVHDASLLSDVADPSASSGGGEVTIPVNEGGLDAESVCTRLPSGSVAC